MELFVNGYGGYFHNAAQLWSGTIDPGWRNMREVGLASARMAEHDVVPLLGKLLPTLNPDGATVLDFGCGNALYLVALCKQVPSLRGVGVEPSQALCVEAERLIRQEGLEGRITIANSKAEDYAPELPPDFILFGFVVQELIEQIGVDSTVEMLRSLGLRFPHAWFVVLEIDSSARKSIEAMRNQPLLRGFYNYYYTLHELTAQRLLTFDEWRDLFGRAGFVVHSITPVDPEVDDTGLVAAFALSFAHGAAAAA
jgi:2-ketoarginine methyltransferase